MASLPSIYAIQASDAPQHTGRFRKILQNLQTENRIQGFTMLGPDDDLSSVTDQVGEEDLILIMLSRQLEDHKKEIENKFKSPETSQAGVRVAEILVDNVVYDNEFITFPTNLQPIRDREDMDVAWSGIGENLKDMFPVKKKQEWISLMQTNYSKYIKVAGQVVLLIGLAFIFYKLFDDDPDRVSESDHTVTEADMSSQPISDFPGGSRRVYSADFSEWQTRNSEHGSVTLGFGNSYVLQPSSNTWIGGRPNYNIPAIEEDFVIDLRFRIEERNPSSSLRINFTGGGTDAESVVIHFTIWNDNNVVYSLTKDRVRSGEGLSVPHRITEEKIAEREQLPLATEAHDWSQGSKLSLKREGGKMQFFVNDIFIKEFSVSRFPIEKTSIGAAWESKIMITSLEARARS